MTMESKMASSGITSSTCCNATTGPMCRRIQWKSCRKPPSSRTVDGSIATFVLIAFDWVQECWAKVAWAVRVRPWILHWMEEVAKATEMRRIVAANLGSLEPGAIFSKET